MLRSTTQCGGSDFSGFFMPQVYAVRLSTVMVALRAFRSTKFTSTLSPCNLGQSNSHPFPQCLWWCSMSSPAPASRWNFWYHHLLFRSDSPFEPETSLKFNRTVTGVMVFVGWALLIFVLTRANL